MENKAERLDLSSCDKEPIHVLGRIQSFGCVLVLTNDWLVAYISSNSQEILGIQSEKLIGKSLRESFGSHLLHSFRSALQTSMITGRPERIFGLELVEQGRRFDACIHFNGDHILIEFEPISASGKRDDFIRAMLNQFHGMNSIEELFNTVASCTRLFSGFDRVMVYQFSRDGSGEVIAESVEEGLESFLGLKYPASDIPKQARILYKKNLLRLIADVDDQTHTFLPDTQPENIDLSMIQLRAVSPVHIQYLKNMGVKASMSISLLVEGELWGLIACHHYSPKFVDFKVRTHLELFAELFSMELSRRLLKQRALQSQASNEAYRQVVTTIDTHLPLHESLAKQFPLFMRLIECDGMACLVDGNFAKHGSSISETQAQALADELNRRSNIELLHARSINEILSNYHPSGSLPAGFLALPISKSPRDYLFFFRRPEVAVVRWAGNPEKPVTVEKGTERLTPRESFNEWVETHKDYCKDWSEAELSLAVSIRIGILEMTVRHLQEKEDLRNESHSRQELLISELNHRVRNILNLVSAIVAQTNLRDRDVNGFIETLSARITALSSAHDQLTHSSWGDVSLIELLNNEVRAYLGARDSIHMQGPKVKIKSYAVTPIVLVIHELLTNAAKYGGLSATSTNGSVQLEWDKLESGGLEIRWKEFGGPPVESIDDEGFGMTIIKSVIPHELQGDAEVRILTTGLSARFTLPRKYVVFEKKESVGSASSDPVFVPAKIAKPKVTIESCLIVEDSLLIALDVKKKMTAMGAQKVFVAGSTSRARKYLENERPSVVVLDINLGNETTIDLARELGEKNIPYLFATGYGAEAEMPEDLVNRKILTKPLEVESLEQALSDLGVLEVVDAS